jgi:endonuclease III
VAATSFLSSVLRWLETGYPDGVPGPDRVPLLVLLRSTALTEDQIKEVVHKITATESAARAHGQADQDEVAEFISDMTHYDAGPENIRRVAATLAAAGWPLAGVDLTLAEPGDDAGREAS